MWRNSHDDLHSLNFENTNCNRNLVKPVGILVILKNTEFYNHQRILFAIEEEK